LEGKYNEAQAFFDDLVRDVGSMPVTFEEDMRRLSMIPAKAAFGKFFGVGDSSTVKGSKKPSNATTTLASFVDRPTTKKAVSATQDIVDNFRQQIDAVAAAYDNIVKQYDTLSKATNLSQSRSLRDDPEEPARLLQDIEAVANKVAADCERVLGFSTADPKAPATASKIALQHTRNFLPDLRDYSREMGELLRNAIDQKNAAVFRLIDNLQLVASGEANAAEANRTVTHLNPSEDDHMAIRQAALVTSLPFDYGSLLVEAVRRHEWVDKMKRDSSCLAEELAGYQDEEQKRRKKWLKGMSNVIQDSIEGRVLGVEINLQGEQNNWPEVARQELDDYIKSLEMVDVMKDVVDSLTQMVRELDRPTRQQVKRAKTFKMGSVHEAGFGKGSLMLRGEDEMRVLKEANSKLEDELKGHKSRIRKLEDLLHRQSHVGRLSLINGSPSGQFQDPSTPVEQSERPLPFPSPRQEELSRRSSVSSRRFSNQPPPMEDKSLARRIVQLETELAAEREARSTADKEIAELRAAHDNVKRLEEESNSTKKDLMENMEAQQKEFAIERRGLEEEKRTLQEEIDRIQGSRDNERGTVDEQMQAILADLDLTKKEAAEDLRKAEDQLRRRDEIDTERQIQLKCIFASLGPEQTVPDDPARLISDLEKLAQRTVDHAKDLANALALAKSENENLEETLDGQKAVTAEVVAQLETKQAEITRANEELESERQKAASLTTQIEEANAHLNELRAKFADGETGSEALRKQLAEEEARVAKLSGQLANTKSHVNGLDVELLSLQSKYRNLQDLEENAKSRLLQRSQRAKELSQRLYAHNDRLYRLLEALGFVVTHDEEGNMVIQRASKASSSAVIVDSAAASRQLSSPTPASRLLDDLSDLSSILWMEKDSAEEEGAKYQEFKDKLALFNIDTFCDSIAKRMRDIEHTARKWQKEAKAYRDRAHRYQHEAHDKIAFRTFKEGDLALFLPTRNQATRPWAAFNVGAPHYFLREQESHKLGNKEWLVARITKVQERVVDLSKAMESARAAVASNGRPGSIAESEAGFEDDNPFDLSDGLRWYLLDAQEEKPGAPGTPGLGKTIATATTVDARGSIRMTKKRPGDPSAVEEVNRQLSKSLDSRRSSTHSKTSAKGVLGLGIGGKGSNEALRPGSKASRLSSSPIAGGSNEEQAQPTVLGEQMKPPPAPAGGADLQEQVRQDLLFGP
jgi:autophagy-related protein 11